MCLARLGFRDESGMIIGISPFRPSPYTNMRRCKVYMYMYRVYTCTYMYMYMHV